MVWSPLGVSKMREKMELADYELTGIENLRSTEVSFAYFIIDHSVDKSIGYQSSAIDSSLFYVFTH